MGKRRGKPSPGRPWTKRALDAARRVGKHGECLRILAVPIPSCEKRIRVAMLLGPEIVGATCPPKLPPLPPWRRRTEIQVFWEQNNGLPDASEFAELLARQK